MKIFSQNCRPKSKLISSEYVSNKRSKKITKQYTHQSVKSNIKVKTPSRSVLTVSIPPIKSQITDEQSAVLEDSQFKVSQNLDQEPQNNDPVNSKFKSNWQEYMNMLVEKGNLLFSPIQLTKQQLCSLIHRQIDICNKIFIDVVLADSHRFAQIISYINQNISLGWEFPQQSILTQNSSPITHNQPCPSQSHCQEQTQNCEQLDLESEDQPPPKDIEFNDYMYLHSLKGHNNLESADSEFEIDDSDSIVPSNQTREFNEIRINSIDPIIIPGTDLSEDYIHKDNSNLFYSNEQLFERHGFENQDVENVEMQKKICSVFNFRDVSSPSHYEEMQENGTAKYFRKSNNRL